MNKTGVFLVDDHQMILDGIKSMFQTDESLQFIGECTDGLIAKDEISRKASQIDLLITDINIPGISGIELCSFVKEEFPQIKVLIISMYQNNTVITEALMADADGYLLKTGGYHQFRQAINRVLDGGSYYSEEIYPIIRKEYQKVQEKEHLIQKLTSREMEILILIVREFTSSEIAEELNISKKTVDNHRQNILFKTNSNSTIGLVKYALNAGLKID